MRNAYLAVPRHLDRFPPIRKVAAEARARGELSKPEWIQCCFTECPSETGDLHAASHINVLGLCGVQEGFFLNWDWYGHTQMTEHTCAYIGLYSVFVSISLCNAHFRIGQNSTRSVCRSWSSFTRLDYQSDLLSESCDGSALFPAKVAGVPRSGIPWLNALCCQQPSLFFVPISKMIIWHTDYWSSSEKPFYKISRLHFEFYGNSLDYKHLYKESLTLEIRNNTKNTLILCKSNAQTQQHNQLLHQTNNTNVGSEFLDLSLHGQASWNHRRHQEREEHEALDGLMAWFMTLIQKDKWVQNDVYNMAEDDKSMPKW